MSKIDYAKELGISSEDTTPAMEVESNGTGDIVQDSITEESIEVTDGNTEPDISVELRKQIEGLEKRIGDKDDYINILREQSKAKEESTSEEQGGAQSDDFWEDPEAIVKNMQETIRIQQMQIQETVYANTVENYWKTVNPEALQTAVATDTEFAKEFNGSNEPYRLAYEYLSKKSETKLNEESKLREQIKADLIKEMGIKEQPTKKDTVPSMGNMGGSNGSKSEAPDDGFAAVFGKR